MHDALSSHGKIKGCLTPCVPHLQVWRRATGGGACTMMLYLTQMQIVSVSRDVHDGSGLFMTRRCAVLFCVSLDGLLAANARGCAYIFPVVGVQRDG